MRIGELSTRTGLATSRIRYYERHGVIPKATRSENGYREYPDSAEKTLCLIDTAQKLGFSLREIREGLSHAGANFPTRAAMTKALKEKLESLDQHIADARARRRALAKLIGDMEIGKALS